MARGYRGHVCWVCERVRPNEQFTRRGRARHVCKRCARLGRAELEVRTALRALHRAAGWRGQIRNRPPFDTFLVHPIERVRVEAERLLAAHEIACAIRAFDRCLEDVFELDTLDAVTPPALPEDPFAHATDELVPDWMSPPPAALQDWIVALDELEDDEWT